MQDLVVRYVSTCFCTCVYICVSKALWSNVPPQHHTQNSWHSCEKKLQHSENVHQPVHGIWWPNDQDKVGHQNTHRRAWDTMYAMQCWWACVCNYTGEFEEKAHCAASTHTHTHTHTSTTSIHTDPFEGKRSRCTEGGGSRPVWSQITKQYAWHTCTHIKDSLGHKVMWCRSS